MRIYHDVAASFQVPQTTLAILEVISANGSEVFIDVDKADGLVTISAVLFEDADLVGGDFRYEESSSMC